jgi:hypothetical protein
MAVRADHKHGRPRRHAPGRWLAAIRMASRTPVRLLASRGERAEAAMGEAQPSVSGVEVPAAALETAEALALAVRQLAGVIPFGTEPLELLVALEELAAEDGS